MFQSPTSSISKHHLKRIAQVAGVLLVLLAAKPAIQFFLPTSNAGSTNVLVHTTEPSTTGTMLASVATTALEEALPVTTDFPEIQVTAALVKEFNSGSTLLAYRTTARWPLASVTKLMTAVVALETLGPAAIVEVEQEAVDTEGEAGNFKAGQKYSVIDLVRAMLTVSSNDAAMVLANAYDKKQLGGAVYADVLNKSALFTAAMQQKARDLGMSETYYGDPTGLSVVNQSIVTDLNTLMNYVVTNHPEILEITRKKENVILERKTMTRRTLININEFAGQADFVGGKTGKTDEAGGNLLSLFKYNGKQYLIIVLGTEDRFGETRKLYQWVKDGAQ